MAVQSNEYTKEAMNEAAQTLYTLNADEMVRLQCQARQDAEHWEHLTKKRIERQQAEIEAQRAEIADKDAEIADKDAEIADKDARIAALEARLAAMEN